jgi:uncharacterized membrane protein YqaE (UPF0057 family)
MFGSWLFILLSHVATRNVLPSYINFFVIFFDLDFASCCYFVRGEENGVFEMFEKKIERADPSNSGHYEPCELLSKFFSFFLKSKRGWVRCFFISCILCLFGWFPSVIFGHFMCFYHIYRLTCGER